MRIAPLFALLAGCKALSSMAVDAGPVDTELAAQMPSPTNPNANFAVGDGVSVIADDGTFNVDATVEAIAGKLAFIDAPAGNTNRFQLKGWAPVDASHAAPPGAKTADRGYQLRIGNGRMGGSQWFPAAQVFPAPWAGVDNIKVGGTFYQRRFGNFPNVKCTVTEASATNRGPVTAKCEGSETPVRVNREDMALFFKVPATLADVQTGQIVYFDKMYWAIVVGKQDTRPVVRQNGFASKDKAVDLSKIEEVR